MTELTPTVCHCKDGEYAMGNKCFVGQIPEDHDLLNPYVGKWVCFNCGGVPEVEPPPEKTAGISGGTILFRLKILARQRELREMLG